MLYLVWFEIIHIKHIGVTFWGPIKSLGNKDLLYYCLWCCPLLTSATAVIRISCWFLIDVYILATDTLNRGSGMIGPITWFNPPKPGLQSGTLCGAVCIINSYNTLLNWPIISLLILFILFSMFFVLMHDYTLCNTGSPCCNFGYYPYISIWPNYIVIHLPITHLYMFEGSTSLLFINLCYLW